MNTFELALSKYNTIEVVGGEHNPVILEFFAKVGHSWVDNDELAWCAAFVGWALEEAGIKSTRKLNARSYVDFAEETTMPKAGDIVVLSRKGKNSIYGHVGFYISEDDAYVFVYGGNQSNRTKISAYSKNRVLTYRKYDNAERC